jgi:hypothetical protein
MKGAVFLDASSFSEVDVRRFAPRPLKMKAVCSSEMFVNFSVLHFIDF